MDKEYLATFVDKVVKLHNQNMMLRATVQRRDEKIAELYLMLEGYKIQMRKQQAVNELADKKINLK